MNTIKKSTIAMHALMRQPVLVIGPHGSGRYQTVTAALSEAGISWHDLSLPMPYDYNGYYDMEALNKFISYLMQLDINALPDSAFVFDRFQQITAPIAAQILDIIISSKRRVICMGTSEAREWNVLTDRCEKIYF